MMEYLPGELKLTIAANSLHTGLLGQFTTALYHACQPMLATSYVLIITIALALRRNDYRVGLAFGFAVAITWLPIVFFKMVAGRPRPDTDLLPNPPSIVPADWSFPSGHTAFVVALMMTVFIFVQNIWAKVVSVGLVVTMSATVLIVGVHYPTDVLASLVWSGLVSPVVVMLVRYGTDRLPVQVSSNS